MAEIAAGEGVKTYSIGPEGVARARKQLLIRSAVVGVVTNLGLAALLAYFMSQTPGGFPVVTYLALTCPLMALLSGFSALTTFISYRVVRSRLENMQITLTGDAITVSGTGINPVTVKRDEITELSESKRYGMVIRTQNRYQIPFISPYIDHYDQIRATLIGWRPLAEKPQRFMLPTFQMLVPLVAIGLIALVPNIMVIAAAWLGVCAFSGYMIRFMLRVPELKSGTRGFGIGAQAFMLAIVTLFAISSILRILLANRGY